VVQAPARVALVTGAARGIGEAISAALAAVGYAVAIADIDDAGAKSTAARLAEDTGSQTLGVCIDVADSASVHEAVQRIERELGPIEVLVNNAGVDVIQPFVDSTEETWQRLVQINLLGTVRCTRAVLDGMRERGRGRIISLGSDAGRVGSSGEAVYSATKGGVIAFTKALAREVARDSITVNCVCPGPTDTALLDQVAEASQKLYDGLARAIPLRRIGQPTDIAPAVAFLASEGAGFITGQTLSVSGGLTMA
jgi:2-hydroxycyclohexanecarboxyl-CoA dehydrogenase